MNTLMNADNLTSISDLQSFLDGTQAIAFKVISNKDECYQWIQKTLIRFRYISLKKAEKGVVIQYLIRMTGYSRQQLTRLIKPHRLK